MLHKPVLLNEVFQLLALKPGMTVLDGTVGSGGHAEAILQAIGPSGHLIGLDRDPEAIQRTRERLKTVSRNVTLLHSNFSRIHQALSSLNIRKVNAVLLDIGISSEQLDEPKRGFSFTRDGPLDMRMDQSAGPSAADLIAGAAAEELASMFREYGEERFAKKIAHAIVRERAKKSVTTTAELANIIAGVTPARFRFGRIHPATRVFQALRIAVNQELRALDEALPQAFDALAPLGRLAVISFHSLEDRRVKQFFVGKKQSGEGKILTKKPVQAAPEELRENPRARSAKLRVIERCS